MKGSPLLFNPVQVPAEELDATFVAREGLRDRLLEQLRADATSTTKRHWLLIGQRGSGKSHLVEVVSRQLAREGWVVARLPEEHFKVRTLGELFEQIALLWGADRGALQRVTDDERLALVALDEIVRIRRETGRHGLVVLENLDVLIDRKLDRRAQHRLREVLMGAPPFLLLATATSRFHGMTREDAPFYDFFQTMELGELRAEEVSLLIERRARWHGDQKLLDDLGRVRERVHVIHHFSGGNPRVALALYAVLRNGLVNDLRTELHQLLDEVTPYYLARIGELSTQEQRVLAAIALAESPPTQAALARECRLGTSQVTAIIQRLEAAQMVRRSEPGGGRRVVEVAGRLLRVWFQMRESPDERERLGWLTDFFRAWYRDPEEVRAAAREIGHTFWERVKQGDAGCVDSLGCLPHLQDVLRREDPREADWLAREVLTDELPEGVVDRLEPLIEQREGALRDALCYVFCRACDESGQPGRALKVLKKCLQETPTYWWAWSEYRRLLVASGAAERVHDELLQLASREDAEALFVANVGVDALGHGQLAQGEALLTRGLSEISCRHCESEVLSRWVSVTARKNLGASAGRALAQGKARLDRATFELLCLHQEAERGAMPSSDRIAKAAKKFAAVKGRYVTRWVTALLRRGVTSATAATLLDVFHALGAPPEVWIEFVILVAEGEARWRDAAIDRMGDALSPSEVARLFNLLSPLLRKERNVSATAIRRAYEALRARGVCDSIPLMDDLARVLDDDDGLVAALARLDGPTRDALRLLVTPPRAAS